MICPIFDVFSLQFIIDVYVYNYRRLAFRRKPHALCYYMYGSHGGQKTLT